MGLPAHIGHRALATCLFVESNMLAVDQDALTQSEVDYFEELLDADLLKHDIIRLKVAMDVTGLMDIEHRQGHLNGQLLDYYCI